MSQTSDFIFTGVARNFQPRQVLDTVVDRVTAAKAKVATNPAVACIELDSAMASIAKVIRGLNSNFDFGFPSPGTGGVAIADATAERDLAQKALRDAVVENTALREEVKLAQVALKTQNDALSVEIARLKRPAPIVLPPAVLPTAEVTPEVVPVEATPEVATTRRRRKAESDEPT